MLGCIRRCAILPEIPPHSTLVAVVCSSLSVLLGRPWFHVLLVDILRLRAQRSLFIPLPTHLVIRFIITTGSHPAIVVFNPVVSSLSLQGIVRYRASAVSSLFRSFLLGFHILFAGNQYHRHEHLPKHGSDRRDTLIYYQLIRQCLEYPKLLSSLSFRRHFLTIRLLYQQPATCLLLELHQDEASCGSNSA